MTCVKRRVRCIIITDQGNAFVGENLCDRPQPVCPRSPTDDYERCTSVCRQPGHAEIVALKKLDESGERGMMALVFGIDHLCKDCARALSGAGISQVIINSTPIAVAPQTAMQSNRIAAYRDEAGGAATTLPETYQPF